LGGVASTDRRRSIQIEATTTDAFNPAAVSDQAVLDDHWQPRGPRHLLDGPVLIDTLSATSNPLISSLQIVASTITPGNLHETSVGPARPPLASVGGGGAVCLLP